MTAKHYRAASSASGQSRRICYVRAKSAWPSIADKVLERPFGRSGPNPEIPAARQANAKPEAGGSKALLASRESIPAGIG